MVFGLFKRTDPVCGMKEEKGKGIVADGKWFCSSACQKEFGKKEKTGKDGKTCCGNCH